MAIQLSLHHLLKNLFFHHRIILAPYGNSTEHKLVYFYIINSIPLICNVYLYVKTTHSLVAHSIKHLLSAFAGGLG